jgi:tetratricopeptide (TPR) repeat protein
VRRIRGEVTLALQAYTQAEQARRAVLARSAVQHNAVRAAVDLAETLSSQGFVLLDRGEPRAALGRFGEALKLVQGVQPTVADDVAWRLVALDAQDGHAHALEDLGQRDAAFKVYELALRSAHALVDAAPYLPEANYLLAVAVSRVATRDERADRKQAVLQYAQINDTLHKLVRWDPTNAAWRLDSSATEQLLADATAA